MKRTIRYIYEASVPPSTRQSCLILSSHLIENTSLFVPSVRLYSFAYTTMVIKCRHNLPLEGTRPSSPSSNHSPNHQHTIAQVNESPDAILSDIARLFADFSLKSRVERVSAKSETPNEKVECMLGKSPKCKNYDILSEIAGASYFIVNRAIYGWDRIGWSMFPVNELCEPLDPFIFCGTGHNQDIVIMDAVFRIDENDTLFHRVSYNQWIQEPLYHTYGDAFAASLALTAVYDSYPPSEAQISLPTNFAGDEFVCASSRPPFLGLATAGYCDDRSRIQSNEPKLLQTDDKKPGSNNLSSIGLIGSLHGFGLGFDSPDLSTTGEVALFDEPDIGPDPTKNLLWGEDLEISPVFNSCDVNGADLSTPFLGEGQSPSLDSITKWVEFQKSTRHVSGPCWVCPLMGCGKVLRRPHALKVYNALIFGLDK
ncbi:unnamed protein product [Rhizoctonia solani]|uniref:Uncharacterized protein n=1 Tax=Rhizoctonia solani TaxID=456999 RepID=A0A8H3CBZ1_9AGAM|nr:unnamed protein product [Rhizoctonia solani]